LYLKDAYRHIPTALCHYLDDFLPIFKPSISNKMADAAVVWIKDLEKELLGLSSAGQDNQANNVSGIPGSGTRFFSNGGASKLDYLCLFAGMASPQMLHAEGTPRVNRIPTVLHPSGTAQPYIHQGLDKFFNDILE